MLRLTLHRNCTLGQWCTSATSAKVGKGICLN